MWPQSSPSNGSSLVAVAYIHVNLSRLGAPVKRDEGPSIKDNHMGILWPQKDVRIVREVAGIWSHKSVLNADDGDGVQNIKKFVDVMNGWHLTGDERPTPLLAAGCGGGEGEED